MGFLPLEEPFLPTRDHCPPGAGLVQPLAAPPATWCHCLGGGPQPVMSQGAGVEGKPQGSQWVASAQGPGGVFGVHSSVSSAMTQTRVGASSEPPAHPLIPARSPQTTHLLPPPRHLQGGNQGTGSMISITTAMLQHVATLMTTFNTPPFPPAKSHP